MRKKVLIISMAVVLALTVAGVFAINTLFSMLITQEFRMSSEEEDNKGGRPGEEILNEGAVPGQDSKKGGQDLPSKGAVTEGEIAQGQKGTDKPGKNNNNSTTDTKLIVDEKKIKEIEKKVSLADKTRALSILFKSLSSEDIRFLYQLAGGGITDEEKKQAMALLREKLTPDQKQAIKDLYAKYEKLLED
ncbi:MAG: hypothetical protein GX066_03905 [Clostridiaceae bacterium]|nr:hypothetical protein [Clostridiaceae bacterium]